jgi:hypothetical protein
MLNTVSSGWYELPLFMAREVSALQFNGVTADVKKVLMSQEATAQFRYICHEDQ